MSRNKRIITNSLIIVSLVLLLSFFLKGNLSYALDSTKKTYYLIDLKAGDLLEPGSEIYIDLSLNQVVSYSSLINTSKVLFKYSTGEEEAATSNQVYTVLDIPSDSSYVWELYNIEEGDKTNGYDNIYYLRIVDSSDSLGTELSPETGYSVKTLIILLILILLVFGLLIRNIRKSFFKVN